MPLQTQRRSLHTACNASTPALQIFADADRLTSSKVDSGLEEDLNPLLDGGCPVFCNMPRGVL